MLLRRERTVVSGVGCPALGRSDYRSKVAKVSLAQRKELAMCRIIICGEKRANATRSTRA